MARIFRSADRGRTWSAQVTPILAGPSSGIFSIACGGRSSRLVAMGGDYKDATRARTVAIHSEDGGQSWALSPQQPGGYRSAVGSFSDGEFAAVGPNGTDISHDAGVHWTHTDPLNLNAVSFKGAAGWGVGPNGMIARFKSPVPTSNLVLPAAIGTSGSIHWQTLAAFELVGVWHLLAHPR